MKIRNAFLVLSAVASLAVAGCTQKEVQTAQNATTVAADVCEVVFTAVDPTLAPLCTTAEQVAEAIEALTAQVTVAVTDDAGAAVGAATVAVKPTNTQVYQWLVAHGTKPVTK